MSQDAPGRSGVVPAFFGGALAAAPTAALIEISVDNATWLPIRFVAGAAAGLLCIGATGAVSRAAARRARSSIDGRVEEAILSAGDEARGKPLAVQTTRDLPLGELGGTWSGRVEYEVHPHRGDAPYTTFGQLDVQRGDLPLLGRPRKGITEINEGDRGIRVRDADPDASVRIPDTRIPPQRRFRGVGRVRRSVAAPIVAFLVGFGGAGYGVHQYLPDTSGLSGSIQSAFSSSDSDLPSGNAEANLKSALENAEDESPGATGRLTYVSINDDSTVSVRYFDPESNKEVQIYDEGDPTEIGPGTSRGTFTFTPDQIPPLNTMIETAASNFDILWFTEIKMPDEESVLPANHVDGEPIVEFASRGTNEKFNYLQATLDGTFAPLFDTESIDAAYAQLVSYLADLGIAADQPIFANFGMTGPLGGSGAVSASAPGSALWATMGPGPFGAGDLGIVSGSFPTFEPDDTEWGPEELATLIPITAVSPDVLSSVLATHASEMNAEPTDLASYYASVEGPGYNGYDDPALIRMVFPGIENSNTKFTLDGQKLPTD